MDLRNISEAKEWFEVLQTSQRSQTAMMTLAAGASTGRKAEAHKKSDQVLLMLKGKLSGKVGREKVSLKKRRCALDSGRDAASVHKQSQEIRRDF